MRLTEIVTEAADTSTHKMMLKDAVEPLKTDISKLFPNSYLSVVHSTNILDCITIRFALEPKSEWKNAIFHNASYMIIMINEKNGKQRETGEGFYEVEVSSADHHLPKLRRKTASLSQIVDYLTKYFTILKQTVEES